MDNTEVIGVDLTFRAWPTAWKKWTFQNEWFQLKREVPVGTLNRNGWYSFLNYRMDKYLDFGIRYDYAENAMPVEIVEKAVSLIANYHLTETSALSAQLKRRDVDDEEINEAWIQLTFGIGPHSHELE